MTIVEHIRAFADKSGGLAKIREARRAMGAIPRDQVADYVRRVARSDAGARQLFAASLLGFVVADIVCHGTEPSA